MVKIKDTYEKEYNIALEEGKLIGRLGGRLNVIILLFYNYIDYCTEKSLEGFLSRYSFLNFNIDEINIIRKWFVNMVKIKDIYKRKYNIASEEGRLIGRSEGRLDIIRVLFYDYIDNCTEKSLEDFLSRYSFLSFNINEINIIMKWCVNIVKIKDINEREYNIDFEEGLLIGRSEGRLDAIRVLFYNYIDNYTEKSLEDFLSRHSFLKFNIDEIDMIRKWV